jgi:hypothetical protein
VRRLLAARQPTRGRRCFSVNGFSLHANRFVGTKERGVLEKLLAYGARGAFSHRRLSLADPNDPSGDLVYTLKTPWSDGTEAIKLSARELIEKLVALIPPPHIHMIRYFGILASHSKWRRQVVLRPDVKKGFVALQDGVERMSWAKLLARGPPACIAPRLRRRPRHSMCSQGSILASYGALRAQLVDDPPAA